MKKTYSLLISLVYICTSVLAQDDRTIDYGLEKPNVITNPLPEYDYNTLDYGMTIGIEQTPNGRIWVCWVGGNDGVDAFFVLATSDDDGESWSKPRLVIDSHDMKIGHKRSTIVGNLWTDPLGRLWLFFDQSLDYFDGRGGNWYIICENPDSDTPVWSEPQRMWHGCSLNKPIVTLDDLWVAPVCLWPRGMMWHYKDKEAYRELDPFRQAYAFASSDEGKTWERRGGVEFPHRSFDEHHIVERKDGSWWMTARTNDGIYESISHDKGYTWSKPQKYLPHTASRHFVRRLSSGRLLLVKHGEVNKLTKGRSQLMAFLSDDDGLNWYGGLMLDPRRSISYPDGFQSNDGYIYVSYDRCREPDGEILMVRFTEDDIIAKAFISPRSKSRILISRPGAIEYFRPNNLPSNIDEIEGGWSKKD